MRPGLGGLVLLLAGCGAPVPPPSPPASPASAPAEPPAFVASLAAGEYLELEVMQEGVDLVLELHGPGGRRRRLDTWYGASGDRGLERLSFVADVAGRYELGLRGPAGGAHRLRLTAQRPSTVEDRARSAAEGLVALAAEAESPRARRRARSLLARAARTFRALGEPQRAAEARFRRAELAAADGMLEAARTDYGRALRAYRRLGDRAQEALVLHHRGYLEVEAGEVAAARRDFARALPLWRSVGDRLGAGLTLSELGRLHRQAGEARAALAAYDEALPLFEAIGDRRQEARVLHNRGRLYAALGQPEQAADDLDAALALRRALGPARETASALASRGWLYLAQDEAERAAHCFAEARQLAPGSLAAAIAEAGQGLVLEPAGSARAALQAAERAFERAGEPAWQAMVASALARLDRAGGDLPAAFARLERALALFARAGNRDGVASALFERARLRQGLGDLAAAEADVAAALGEVEEAPAPLTPELAAAFFAQRQTLFDLAVELALARAAREPGRGHAERALGWAERGRARTLRELVERVRGEHEDPALAARERELSVRLHALEARGEPATERAELLRELAAVRERRTQLPAVPRAPRAAATLDVARIQRELLDAETVLVEYRLGGSASTLWVVTRRSFEVHRLPGRADLEARAGEVHRLAQEGRRGTRQRLANELASLSRLLLEPAAETLARHRRWLLVLDGGLARVPFAALSLPGAGDEPLVARHELVRLPSASLAAALRARSAARRPAPQLLAVVADPDLEPRLAHAAAEAHAVAAAAPRPWRVEGAAFDQVLFDSGALARFRIVHLVTHARADDQRPELSHLALATRDAAGRPRLDTRLYAFEAYRLRLPAELVTLSACSTALGREVRGEGLLGLTHGFFHAGAQRLLVSLWDVDDRSTSVLMGELYRRLLGLGQAPGEALRSAQDQLRQDPRWRSPRHWAGFVLEGDWRPLAGSRAGD